MTDQTGDPAPDDAPRGADLARRALEEARAQAKAQGKSVGAGRTGPVPVRRRRAGRRRWSGPGPDQRDPQSLGQLASGLVARRGWGENMKDARILGAWTEVVGAEIAEHATPVRIEDKTLMITASSTAWATQLRYMQRQILGKIAAAVGPGVVTKVRIHGPTAPSWRHGGRHVSGRGPRDTYG